MFREIICIYLLTYLFSGSDAYPQVRGKEFYYKGQKVFLSGSNIAWNQLGSDGEMASIGGTGLKGMSDYWVLAHTEVNVVRI